MGGLCSSKAKNQNTISPLTMLNHKDNTHVYEGSLTYTYN